MALVPRRIPAALLVTLALAAPGGRAAWGHGEGGQPPPTPPSVYVTMQKLYPPRWSWIHWWEANRDPFLKVSSQSTAEQRADPAVVKAYRDQAVKALREAAKDDAPEARAAAALALGRMGEAAAFDALTLLAEKDPKPGVRMPALVAFGLLDTPPARDLLLTQNYATDQLLEAGCSGLGLLARADDPKVSQTLQKGAGSDKAGLASISAWGLRVRPDAGNVRFLQAVLARSKSPWLASEAILALGEQGDPKAVRLLADLLLATRAAESVAAWEALKTHDRDLAKLTDDKKGKVEGSDLEGFRRLYRGLSDWRLTGPNAPGTDPGALTIGIKVGIEQIYMNRLRASAAIALGGIRHPSAQEVLLKALALRDDRYSDVYKGLAIMSLARIGDQDILPPLLEYLAPKYRDGKRKTVREVESPLRGYAALALGLYARPRPTPQGPTDPPLFSEVCQALAERVGDRDEMLEVRAAAAMGLGLTARTECLRWLHPAKQAATADEDLLIGYLLLASALLGDQNVLKPGKWFLTEVPERQDPSGILGRRAAALALGLMRSPQSIPVLIQAWHLNYHVNREVAVSFALCEAYNVTEALVRLLETSENPLEKAFACRCLGELFSAERPARLARILNQSNYTVKNVKMMPYQTLANEFLYAYLIPCFGDQWQ
ncbi:MAG: HEAT repeat domain-containing protein [Planctomycetes bacterium]|nr:HEAT repeat domain-containing protein [Planctomycetota bacterium]